MVAFMRDMGQVGHPGDKLHDLAVARGQGLGIGAALRLVAPPQGGGHGGQAGQGLGRQGTTIHANGIPTQGGDRCHLGRDRLCARAKAQDRRSGMGGQAVQLSGRAGHQAFVDLS
jgi:hypothetical protein